MTKLLTKAFEIAEKLSTNIQDEIGKNLLEDIYGELKWDETLNKSSGLLEKMANKALENFRNDNTCEKGFDKLSLFQEILQKHYLSDLCCFL